MDIPILGYVDEYVAPSPSAIGEQPYSRLKLLLDFWSKIEGGVNVPLLISGLLSA